MVLQLRNIDDKAVVDLEYYKSNEYSSDKNFYYLEIRVHTSIKLYSELLLEYESNHEKIINDFWEVDKLRQWYNEEYLRGSSKEATDEHYNEILKILITKFEYMCKEYGLKLNLD